MIYEDLTKVLKQNFKKQKRVLDVGCGSGKFIYKAKEIGYEVRACDYNPKVCLFDDIKVDLCNLNIQELPYSDEMFDIIIFTEVIEHLENTGLILGEINRVLKKGGLLYLTTPNITNVKNKVWFLLFSYFLTHKPDVRKGDHITHLTPIFLKSFLEFYEFENVKIRYLNSYFPFTKIKLLNSQVWSNTVVINANKKGK